MNSCKGQGLQALPRSPSGPQTRLPSPPPSPLPSPWHCAAIQFEQGVVLVDLGDLIRQWSATDSDPPTPSKPSQTPPIDPYRPLQAFPDPLQWAPSRFIAPPMPLRRLGGALRVDTRGRSEIVGPGRAEFVCVCVLPCASRESVHMLWDPSGSRPSKDKLCVLGNAPANHAPGLATPRPCKGPLGRPLADVPRVLE